MKWVCLRIRDVWSRLAFVLGRHLERLPFNGVMQSISLFL